MTATPCQTADVPYVASEELRAAKQAMEEAKAAAKKLVDDATERLHKAIAAEAAIETKNNITDIARFMGWTSTYVSRIAREQGVPARIDVEPPKRRKRKAEPGHDTPPS